jgi:hypothetical protein
MKLSYCVKCGARLVGRKCERCGAEYDDSGVCASFVDGCVGTLKVGGVEFTVYLAEEQFNNVLRRDDGYMLVPPVNRGVRRKFVLIEM